MFELEKDSEMLAEAIVEVKKKKRKRLLIMISIAVIIILSILAGMWYLGYSQANEKNEAKIKELEKIIAEFTDTPIVLTPITPEIVMDTLNEKNKNVKELVTAEHTFTNSARFTDTKHIAILPDSWTKKSFIQKWDGTIKAGINLENVKVSVKNKKITVKMPSADIISYEVHPESVEILDEKNNVFNRISVKDKVNFDKETAYEMKSRVVKNGLLKQAEENAKETIESFIRTGLSSIEKLENVQEYKIVFEVID